MMNGPKRPTLAPTDAPEDIPSLNSSTILRPKVPSNDLKYLVDNAANDSNVVESRKKNEKNETWAKGLLESGHLDAGGVAIINGELENRKKYRKMRPIWCA